MCLQTEVGSFSRLIFARDADCCQLRVFRQKFGIHLRENYGELYGNYWVTIFRYKLSFLYFRPERLSLCTFTDYHTQIKEVFGWVQKRVQTKWKHKWIPFLEISFYTFTENRTTSISQYFRPDLCISAWVPLLK